MKSMYHETKKQKFEEKDLREFIIIDREILTLRKQSKSLRIGFDAIYSIVKMEHEIFVIRNTFLKNFYFPLQF